MLALHGDSVITKADWVAMSDKPQRSRGSGWLAFYVLRSASQRPSDSIPHMGAATLAAASSSLDHP